MLKKVFLCRLIAVACVSFLICQPADAARELSIRERLRAPMEELNTAQRLHLACFLGMLDLVQSLEIELRRTSDQFDINGEHNNRLELHIQAKNTHPMQYGDHTTPLHEAVAGGYVPVVAYLLGNGADIHAVTRHNHYTCLHLAAIAGWLPVVRLLVEHGSEVDVLDRDQVTPFHIAVSRGSLQMVRLLFELGADVNARDRVKMTPIYAAIENQAFEKIMCLVRHGADLSAVNVRGQTPFQYALRQAEDIEEQHRSFGAWFCRWLTYLGCVKWDEHFDIIRYLVRNGCEISGADRDRVRKLVPRFDIDAARRTVSAALDEVHESTGFLDDLCRSVVEFLMSREHEE